jgi:hypothetical protein
MEHCELLTIEVMAKQANQEQLADEKKGVRSVLRIRDVYPGSQIRFFPSRDPVSRVDQDPGS